MPDKERERVFISYSHKDQKTFDELTTMLSPAIRAGLIDVWDDTKIDPGAKWKDEITKALASARVAVLLVSNNFLASDFIANHELPPLLEAARGQGVVIFWIYVGDCLYQQTKIASYQAAHDISKPLNRLAKGRREKVLRDVCTKLIRIVQKDRKAVSLTTDPLAIDDSRISFSRAPQYPNQSKGSRPELLRIFDEGYKAIVVCGQACTGKSELVAGFLRARTIFRSGTPHLRHPLGPAGPTMPGEVWFQTTDNKRVFIDPSGEFFSVLMPGHRERQHLPQPNIHAFDFIRRSVRHLAGIVLVVDLTREDIGQSQPSWRNQENDFRFLLPAIRWLRFEPAVRQGQGSVVTAISKRAESLPRIDVPILVIFTKADLLGSYVHELPLDFARRHLPALDAALMTHARRYRYDFCHTMVRTSGRDQPVDRPCGVLLSFEWLLNPPFRWVPRLGVS